MTALLLATQYAEPFSVVSLCIDGR